MNSVIKIEKIVKKLITIYLSISILHWFIVSQNAFASGVLLIVPNTRKMSRVSYARKNEVNKEDQASANYSKKMNF